MGRPSPERRSRLTSDKSPVRASRTPGSEGEVPGDRHLYPTGVARLVGGHLAVDRASAAIHREVQLPPGALATLALLLRQPFARAEDLQPGCIDHHVHRPT